MKVLFILSSSSMSGGSSISFLSYILKMRERDIDIVCTCPCKGPVYEQLLNANIETHIIPVRWNIYPESSNWKQKATLPFKLIGHYLINKQYEKRLLKLCKIINPDIIYTNVSVINIGYNVAQRLKIPHVYHIREFQDLDFNMKIIPSKKSFLNKLRTCYSICITRSIQQHYQLQDFEKSIVIYNGIRDIKKQISKTDKRKVFLFVGRLERKKGIVEVLSAFNKFLQYRQDYKLRVCGEAMSKSMQQYIKEFCSTNNLDKHIEFLGVRNDVDELMQESYALIMASHFEGLGRVTAEAMFNNCLVIGKDSAGTKEQFDNGLNLTGNEIAIRWNTEEDLVQKMLEATQMKRDKYEQMCLSAFNTVNKLYTTEECANSIYKFLNDIASKSNNA